VIFSLSVMVHMISWSKTQVLFAVSLSRIPPILSTSSLQNQV
jgi:hypothetical protein